MVVNSTGVAIESSGHVQIFLGLDFINSPRRGVGSGTRHSLSHVLKGEIMLEPCYAPVVLYAGSMGALVGMGGIDGWHGDMGSGGSERQAA